MVNEKSQSDDARPDALGVTQGAGTGAYTGSLLKNRYLVMSELGRGGISAVYLARDQVLKDKLVAIKFLQSHLAQDEYVAQKFQQEMEALARIEHPGIVGVLDAGETPAGEPFLVMQYVEGRNLRTVLQGEGANGLDLERVANLIRQMAEALSVAHNKGVLHRDLKPENVMLQTGAGGIEHVKLIDFGIAKIRDSLVAPSTVAARQIGTVFYMSPEQLDAKRLAPPSDIYALGVMAYEMVTGRRPFNPDSIFQLLEMQRAGVIVRPCHLRPALPKPAEAVILQALAFEPYQRYQQAYDFGSGLALALTSPARLLPRTGHKRQSGNTATAVLGSEKTSKKPRAKSTKRTRPKPGQEAASNLVHVLFMDIVGYSKLLTTEQVEVAQTLERIVSGTAEVRRAQKDGTLISLDTGDGVALAFFREFRAPVHCAQEVARALRQHPEIGLRMGINTGPAFRRRGINGVNLAGDGINIAQRVMDCGDAGHILVSKVVADFLSQLKEWSPCLHDLGECRVKHGKQVYLFNLYNDEIGNPARPDKMRPAAGETTRATPQAVALPIVEVNETPHWSVSQMGGALIADLPQQAEQSVLVQTLGVSHLRDPHGLEGLMYAPAPLGEMAPEPVFVPMRLQSLQRHIDEIRHCVADLTQRALAGRPREGHGVENVAHKLAAQVLPPSGFVSLLGPGLHPQFDLVQDAASEIPWEIFTEAYFSCPNCRYQLPHHQGPDDMLPFCLKCGHRMAQGGGQLALMLHLTHLVRGLGQPAGEGRQFLFIEDPQGDLCHPAQDPQGVCAGHLPQLRAMIARQGYEIRRLTGKNANTRQVLNAVADPSVVGIYYFGHGYFPHQGDEGCLVLADAPLFAGQIDQRGPAAKFVLLNTCAGAEPGPEWSLDKKTRSVAGVFARGGRGKVVLAPLWPVVNVQAAAMALDFFRHALQAAPLSAALQRTRQLSRQRYEAGEPHLTWMAYRYFGDPNRTLPILAAAPSRVFGDDGQLNLELFSFAIDDVLLRAAKRKIEQERTLVTLLDVWAGLVRKGDLTRFALKQQGVEIDGLYQTLNERQENELPATARPLAAPVAEATQNDEERFRILLEKWMVRRPEQFTDTVIRLFEQADRQAQRRPHRAEDRRICEQDLLEVLLDSGDWAELCAAARIPEANLIRSTLQERAENGVVDENGVIAVQDLATEARRVVEAAHVLSQQRGVFPIPNRMMLAAFLEEEKGHAAQLCQQAGIDPQLLYQVMIAATGDDDDEKDPSPVSFGLSLEACARIVTPVLEAARRNAANPRAVTEAELFQAFCAIANPAFKEWLKDSSLAFDLDRLEEQEPQDLLDETARRILDTAHRIAQNCGAFPISNRLVLAAFLSGPSGYAVQSFRQHLVSSSALRRHLIASSAAAFARPYELTPEACARAVTPMLTRAAEMVRRRGAITERILFQAFCEVSPLELRQWLIMPPWSIDLEAFGAEAGKAEGAPQDTAEAPAETPIIGLNQAQCDEAAWRILLEAGRLARLQGWPEIKTPHLFAALLGESSANLTQTLGQSASLEGIKRTVLSVVPVRPALVRLMTELRLGAHAEQVVKRAWEQAQAARRPQITADDLAAALFADGGGIVGQVLHQLGVAVTHAPDTGSPALRPAADLDVYPDPRPESPTLAALGVDLTERARQGKLPEIVGRETEINTALETLLLTENANPLLIGEAGVGKTAIVEGLAQLLAQGRCPQRLQGMRIIELSAGSLVANTRLRGEFEQRIQEVLAAARENVILFIDEIHTIVGAGNAEGGGPDAGNMLKMALAKGEIRLIGSTTHTEYKRTIARDKALSRRFQGQMIAPPSREATIRILAARCPALEQHHGVRVTPEANAAAVDLSGRYIVDKHWPAKARDVLERACINAVTLSAPALAGGPVEVTPAHVAQVVARQTGIPAERVAASDQAALQTLAARLSQRIIGQSFAVRVVTEAIRRGRHGLADRNRPWGAFLLVGPPGVGKTELAKVLAEEVYGGPDGLLRFDMAEFSEPHSVAKLIGAPPGYVGYTQGAPLVERLRIYPYSLLLFDEIEYAHENVLAVLLRLLAEGTLTDHDGNLADARNAIVILTSNLLHQEANPRRPGFAPGPTPPSALIAQPAQAELRARLERHLQLKLIDRLDAIVRFNPLTLTDLEEIAGQRVAAMIQQAIALHGATVEVAPEVATWLARQAARESQGARAIQRAVDSYLAVPLGAFLSYEDASGGMRLRVFVAQDAIQVEMVKL